MPISKHQATLIVIIALAFAVRLAGINYGLPLWLIGDEPPFVTGALKMIELKTVLPFLHQDELKSILYFPPYLAFLYIPFFVILLAIKFIFLGGSLDIFKNYIANNPSDLFLLARFLNVILGTATIYFLYRIAKNIFAEERPALFAAAILALSPLHIYFSVFARDWVPATLLFTIAIFTLSRADQSSNKKYLTVAIIAGLAFGVSLIAGFIMVFALFWYLFYERHALLSIFVNKTLYAALLIFLVLAALSVALYPYGFHFAGDNSISSTKSFYDYLINLADFLYPVLLSEPILIITALLGFFFCWRNRRNWFWTSMAFIFIYASIFYWFYHYDYRYTIYLFPLLAILAGYGLHLVTNFLPNKKRVNFLAAIPLIFLAITTAHFANLLIQDDARAQARHWVETNLPAHTKIIVFAELMRLASTPEAKTEQQILDSDSLRQIDRAENYLSDRPQVDRAFHALNLYTVENQEFYQNPATYVIKNHYEYLILDSNFPENNPDQQAIWQAFADTGRPIIHFGSVDAKHFIRDGWFPNIFDFLKLKTLGPQITIYKL